MIGLIVARSKNNVIGKNGNIPWKIKGEQKQFRELTTGNVVIMGRKSYEEIGHPLPNRMNIVVSTTTEYQGDNLVSVKSLEDALLLAKGRDVYISGGYGLFKEALQIDVYISGGYGLFKEALQIVDKMYITEVDLNIEDGDTFFPEFDINDFEVLIGETLGEEVKYTRTFYVRKNELSKFWI
ncbi:dihydrofolate reductase [Ruminococcus sp. AF25-17]|nr:dihydrofolate reductase [Ruminococcus sp. AF25-17]